MFQDIAVDDILFNIYGGNLVPEESDSVIARPYDDHSEGALSPYYPSDNFQAFSPIEYQSNPCLSESSIYQTSDTRMHEFEHSSDSFSSEYPSSLDQGFGNLSIDPSPSGAVEARFSQINYATDPYSSEGHDYQTIDEQSLNSLHDPFSPGCSSSSSLNQDLVSADNTSANSRRRRMNLSGWTPEARHRRTREQNNESSRNYRKNKKDKCLELRTQLPILIEKNKGLKERCRHLEDKVEKYINLMRKCKESGCTFPNVNFR